MMTTGVPRHGPVSAGSEARAQRFPLCRFIKKLEHTWKALVHDGVSVAHAFLSPQTQRSPGAVMRDVLPPSVGGGRVTRQSRAKGSGSGREDTGNWTSSEGV